jgi:rare lipoprotein A
VRKNLGVFFILVMPFLITGCAQTQLAAHVVKNIPEPVQSKSRGYFKVGAPYKIKGKRYRPQETYTFEQTGIASWYGPNFHGKQTANGEIFDQYALTAAHKTLQLPSMVEVTNLENGRSIIVRVNDRGPYSGARIIDLSKKSADTLGFIHQGTARVKIRVLPEESRMIADMARRRIDTRGTEVAANENRLLTTPEKRGVTGHKNIQLAATSHVTEKTVLPPQLPAAKSAGEVYVQAASFSTHAQAHSLAKTLRAYGTANVYPADIMGQIVYRVRMGPMDSPDNASVVIAQLEQNGVTRLKNISPIVVRD